MDIINQINTVINNLNNLTVTGVQNMTIVIDSIQRLGAAAQDFETYKQKTEDELKALRGDDDADGETIDGRTYKFGEVSK